MNIRIAILEDNELHFDDVKGLIIHWAESNNHYVKITHFKNGADICSANVISATDLLISDIEILSDRENTSAASENGIDICEKLRENGYSGEIVFLTAFREYVFDGYGVHAMNFLIKPVTYDTVSACMNKYVDLHFPSYYYYHKNNDIIKILYNDIISISSSGHECLIQTEKDVFSEWITLNKFSRFLPKQFIRCHRTCIVNINHVTSLCGTKLVLSNNTHQAVGRNYLKTIKDELMQLANDNFLY